MADENTVLNELATDIKRVFEAIDRQAQREHITYACLDWLETSLEAITHALDTLNHKINCLTAS